MTDDIARSTVARGNNLVLYAPPSPGNAASTLQGIIEGSRPLLGLAPADAVQEWARLAGHYADSTRAVAATTSADRLARIIGPTSTLTLTTPETVLEALRHNGLKLGETAGVLIVWSERWAAEGDQLATLMQDIPKEAQRVIISADPVVVAPLVERYAWRAAMSDSLGPPGEPADTTVRTTPVAWAGRIEALGELVELIDPASVTIWTASDLDHEAIRRRLRTSGLEVSIVTAAPSPSRITIGYDLPAPGQVRELTEASDVILLVPPGTERYVAQLVSTRKPLHLRGGLERARNAAEKTRQEILQALEKGEIPADLELLAPIFERYEATSVAATLLNLWQKARAEGPSEPGHRQEMAARIWVSVGKRDGVTPNDLVALLTRECEVPRAAIGRIEVRDSFTLVEIAKSAGPEQVAELLTGKLIRRRRLVARPDRPSGPLVQRVSKRLPRPKHRGGA